MCRKADRGYNIGHWVCEPEKRNVAADLLAACLQQIDPAEPVYIGVPETNKLARLAMGRFGFSQYFKATRMTFGQKLQNECAEGIFGIGAPIEGIVRYAGETACFQSGASNRDARENSMN